MVERLVYTENVGGSSPSSPTSLRSRKPSEGCRAEAQRAKADFGPGELRLGKPPANTFVSIISAELSDSKPMTYVYILQSTAVPDRHYVGVTGDLRARLQRHNAGEVSHTSKYAPWKIKTYLAFEDEQQAFAFERYIKSASGRAFAKKRL